jgi:hypothetical protein
MPYGSKYVVYANVSEQKRVFSSEGCTDEDMRGTKDG